MPIFQTSSLNPYHLARYFAKIAIGALYDELALYPKPGLVSFIDSGAHKDMNGQLLFRSLFSLRHYFFKVSLHAALNFSPQLLVTLGLEAEKTMNQITHGVNTHRGAIFALGILCASSCKLSMHQSTFSPKELQQAICNDWSHYLRKHHQNNNTHGSLVKEQYKVPDAKQMAIEGYSLVFHTYQELLAYQQDKVFFGLLAYQRLLLTMEDINILYRRGPIGLAFARQHIQKAITPFNKDHSIQEAIKLHAIFSKHHLSPGGVADMLGLMYFLRSIFQVH